MARVRKDLRSFFFVLSLGVLFLFLVMIFISTPGKPAVIVAPVVNFRRSSTDHLKVSKDPSPSSPSPSPYLFMQKERETLIHQALQNGEDLLIRGKLWKLYRPTFTCPYKVSQLGSVAQNGHKWVCGAGELYSNTNSTCVVYSFGVDGDSSFEADILNKTDCTVYAYDHTVTSISKPLHPDNPRVKFTKFGLADSSSRGNPKLKTVKQVMTINGHTWIDILKLDVEGAEFDGMTQLINDFEQLPIGQLQVELHVWVKKHLVYSKIIPWLNSLEGRGLRTFWAAPNARDPAKTKIDCGTSAHSMAQYEYSFINVNWQPFQNSSFTFEKLLMGAAISTDLHYPVN